MNSETAEVRALAGVGAGAEAGTRTGSACSSSEAFSVPDERFTGVRPDSVFCDRGECVWSLAPVTEIVAVGCAVLECVGCAEGESSFGVLPLSCSVEVCERTVGSIRAETEVVARGESWRSSRLIPPPMPSRRATPTALVRHHKARLRRFRAAESTAARTCGGGVAAASRRASRKRWSMRCVSGMNRC